MFLSYEQAEAYLDRCKVPESTRKQLRQGKDGKDALAAVTALQQHHMASVPYENLSMHYSADRPTPPQDLQSIFDRVVTDRCGGLCIQVNLLFSELLRFFGFEVLCTGTRLNNAASISSDEHTDRSKIAYGPWVHVSPIVTIGDEGYLVDTNFNQFGAPYPVPLVHGKVSTDLATQQRRMIYEPVPGLSEHQKWWRMQLRFTPDEPWMDVYCFDRVEWLPLDFQIMTVGLDTVGAGWFRSLVVCFRFILEEGRPVGWLLIHHDQLRRNYKGKTTIVQRFYSEADRVAALESEFGVVLSTSDQRQIMGTNTELRDDGFDFYGEEGDTM